MINDKNLIKRTVEKMERSQQKKKEVIKYIEEHKPYLLGSNDKRRRINECCNVLRFRDYMNGKQRLYKSNFCKYDKLCLACSTRRSIKMIQRFMKGIEQYQLYNKHRYHITLTVRHNKNQTLKTVLDKLCTAKEKLGKRYRNGKRPNQKKKSFMNNFDGIVSSIEVTWSKKNGWHPHIHILACSDKELPTDYVARGFHYGNRELQLERYNVTKDSFQIAMREITVKDGYFDRSGIGEVFKYAVKFSTLDVPHLVELIELQHNRKYHFFSTYGIFRGWKLEQDNKEDDADYYIEKTLEYFPNDEEYKTQQIDIFDKEESIKLKQHKISEIGNISENLDFLSL